MERHTYNSIVPFYMRRKADFILAKELYGHDERTSFVGFPVPFFCSAILNPQEPYLFVCSVDYVVWLSKSNNLTTN